MGGKENPNPGPGSIGITDSQGVYRLKCVQTPDTGAVVGKHLVKINLPEGKAKPLPDRYNAASTLHFEVPESGTDKADFNLTTE
jgi:hypothetical protein